MPLLADGLTVLAANLGSVFALLLSAAGYGLWIAQPFTRDRDRAILLTFTLAIPLGAIAIELLSTAFLLLSRVWTPAVTISAWGIAAGGLVLLVTWFILFRRPLIREFRWWQIAAGASAFLLLLVLHLVFLRGLLAPPYADSATHYLLTSRLMDPSIPLSAVISGSYYHLGFHSLAAWLAALTRSDLLILLPLVGQIFLAIMPLSVYTFALSLTGQRKAALISSLAAALLWSMPAFASNWGKYPAIAGIALFPAVFAAVILLIGQKKKTALLVSVTITLLAGLTWFHTRIVVLLLCAGISFVVFVFLRHHKVKWSFVIGILTWTGCALLYMASSSLSAIYNGNGYLPVIGVILLLPCAFIQHPRFTTGIGLFQLLLFLSVKTPIPAWVPFQSTSLLDQQFLLMTFFLPLSLIVGVGAWGLIHWIRNNWLRAAIWGSLLLWIAASAAEPYRYKPDPCCNFVTSSDLAALDWMKTELPPDSSIYIAGIDKGDGLIGSDAGVWVTPLTGFTSSLLPYDFAWFQVSNHAETCTTTPSYLFAGNQPYSFQINPITHPEWYELVFVQENTSVYRILPCHP